MTKLPDAGDSLEELAADIGTDVPRQAATQDGSSHPSEDEMPRSVSSAAALRTDPPGSFMLDDPSESPLLATRIQGVSLRDIAIVGSLLLGIVVGIAWYVDAAFAPIVLDERLQGVLSGR